MGVKQPLQPSKFRDWQGPSVEVQPRRGGWRTFLQVLGPAYLVAIGYMDPGNWATDLAAGSTLGYRLLWVVALSSLMATLLQSLCCRLGIATGMDLAQASARLLPGRWRLPLWLMAELAIIACDLAELVGSAIALQLLFGLPLAWGVALTVADTLLLLLLQQWGVRGLELVAISLIALVGGCFAVELLLLKPDWGEVIQGFWPRSINPRQGNELFLAAGILGATVMPHNLYLHSSLVQSRRWPIDPMARHWALRYSTWDAVLALSLAFLINCSILILAAGSFHGQQLQSGGRSARGLSAAQPHPGHRLSQHFVRGGSAGSRPELQPHRHPGRSNRDGWLSANSPTRLATPAAHPLPGPGASPGHRSFARGIGHQSTVDTQSSGAQFATALCGDSPNSVLQQAGPDGQPAGAPLASDPQLGLRRPDRGD